MPIIALVRGHGFVGNLAFRGGGFHFVGVVD
jgi:hypothetical protein